MKSTNTTTNTTAILYTRPELSKLNAAARKSFARDIVAAENNAHLAVAYGRKLEVLRAPKGTPADEDGKPAVTFAAYESTYAVCPLSVLKNARTFLADDIDDMAAVFCADAVSVTACKDAFTAFINKHNGNTPAPYAEKAAKDLLRGCKRVRVDRSSADVTPAEVRDTFTSALSAALYAAFNGSKAAPKK